MKRLFAAATAALVLISGTAVAQQAASDHAGKPTILQWLDGKPVINICAGRRGGAYYAVGQAVKDFAGNDYVVNVVAGPGTFGNMKGTLAVTGGPGSITDMGRQYVCHALTMQEDGLVAARSMLPRFLQVSEPVRRMYPEPVLLVTSGSKLDDLDEFVDTDHKIALIKDSGPEITLNAFAVLQPRYQSVLKNIVYVNSWTEALNKVAEKAVSGVFYVGAYDPNPSADGSDSFAKMAHDRNLYFADVYSKKIGGDDSPYQQVSLNTKGRTITTTAVSAILGIHTGVKAELEQKGYYDLFYAALNRAAEQARTSYQNQRMSGWVSRQ